MAPFPPPPTNAIDWANVGFRVREVNGHIESTYSVKTKQWTPLKFVTDPYMRIHGMAPALNYGQQAYEGLKAFRTPGDAAITVFRPDQNARRMQHSAAVVSMPPVPEAMFLDAVKAAVSLNAEFVPPHDTGAAMYVRPQLYGSSAQLGLAPPEEYTFCVFVLPTGVYHGSHPVKALILDGFDRTAPKGTGNAKVGGNYAPVLRWSEAARAQGFGITLHLDSARHREIDEFSTSGFIGAQVRDDGTTTLVVPDSDCVIQSVTSDSICGIARAWGWGVEKRPITYDELPGFTEVMAAGTAAALVPIRSITRRGSKALSGGNVTVDSDGDGDGTSGSSETVTFLPAEREEAGDICAKLLSELQGIQLGKQEDKFGWRFEVAEADGKVEGGRAEGSGQATPSVDQME